MAYDRRKFNNTTSLNINKPTTKYIDDQKITFGTDTDLEIYHNTDGNETHIQGKNSRPVHIRAKDLFLTNAAGDDKAIHVDGGAGGGAATVVKLYYDDVEKFKTSPTGFEFTGPLDEDHGQTIVGTPWLPPNSGVTIAHPQNFEKSIC